MAKQTHRTVFGILKNDIEVAINGGKSSNGVEKKTPHPELDTELTKKFIEFLEELDEKAKTKVKRMNKEGILKSLSNLSEDDAKEVVAALKALFAK